MAIQLAERDQHTSVSGIRKMFDLARTMKAPINFSIGQPDFPVPENVKQAAVKAILDNKNSYSPTNGVPEFLAAVRERLNAGRQTPYEKDEVMITSAVSGGLQLALMALLNPGDEILVPDPYFLMYKQLTNLIGAKPVFVDTYPDFNLHPERFAAAVTPRTKAIILGSPANPTGAVYSASDLEKLVGIARAHNLTIVFDAIYEVFCYDAPFTDVSRLYPEGTVFLGGLSKSHAATGWRLGYAAGPRNVIQAMCKFQQFTFVCAPAPLQHAGIEALATPADAAAAEYKQRRDFIYNGLLDAGYKVQKPGGAFYIFPEAPWGTATEFVDECIRNELMVVAGETFSERDTNFRISYATSMEQLRRGLELLKKLKNGKI